MLRRFHVTVTLHRQALRAAMDFSTWTTHGADATRIRRFLLGGCIGAGLIGGVLAFVIVTSKSVAAATEEEDPVAVELASEPEPEPAAEPPPPERKEQPKPKQPKLTVPTEISSDKLEEKEPVKTDEADPFEEQEPAQEPVKQVVEAPAPVEPVKPPPPKPEIKKPIRISEDMPPPVVVSDVSPEYPASAKAAGVEGTVAVRVVVGTDGTVKSTKVLKGPPELGPACEAAAKQWRFQPYRVDGAPTEFIKLKVCRFRLR